MSKGLSLTSVDDASMYVTKTTALQVSRLAGVELYNQYRISGFECDVTSIAKYEFLHTLRSKKPQIGSIFYIPMCSIVRNAII